MASMLIVEDEFVIAKDIENKLKKMGYEVVGLAASGEEAVQKTSSLKPGLVLMDIKLDGDIDGIEASARIHSQWDIPIIYITAFADQNTLQRAKVTEPFGYILKPIETRELYVAIEIALYKHATEKKLRNQLQRLTTMRRIDQAIISNHDLTKTLNEVLDLIVSQLGVDAAAIMLFNSNSQTLEYAVCHGLNQRNLSRVKLCLGEGLAGKAAQAQQNIDILDIREYQDGEVTPWMAREGFVTYFARPLISKTKVKGVLEIFQRNLWNADENSLELLEILAAQTAIAVDNAAMLQDLISANIELSQAYRTTIEGWSSALELRDLETEGHSQRVTEMTLQLARAMGVDQSEMEHIRCGALLHDVGKMGIPDSILLKEGPLSPEEWVTMRKHPEYAIRLLSQVKFLQPALEIPLHHHEKWDGSGYPFGLRGKKIPLAARIFSVVDVWDALLSNRPYRRGWPEEEVLTYIRDQSGKQFDPEVVEAFLRIYDHAKKEIPNVISAP